MKITRTSPRTGKETTLDLPVTPEQMARFEQGGGLIQNIFPQLTADQREFILSGCTTEDWSALFPPICDNCDHSLVVGDDFDLKCNCPASAFFEKIVNPNGTCASHVSA